MGDYSFIIVTTILTGMYTCLSILCFIMGYWFGQKERKANSTDARSLESGWVDYAPSKEYVAVVPNKESNQEMR